MLMIEAAISGVIGFFFGPRFQVTLDSRRLHGRLAMASLAANALDLDSKS